MQISTKFTIAIHLLAAVDFFGETQQVTSEFLAGSIGSNPVIIRGIMLKLRAAGLIATKRGPGGIALARPLADITFLDVYRAVETGSRDALFHFHERPNPQCPVGRNIQLIQGRKSFESGEIRLLHLDKDYLDSANLVHGRGCPACGGTGYKGRMGIYEIFLITEDMQYLIYNKESSDKLRAAARQSGMRTLREDGLRKAAAGTTTVSEVLAVTVGDEE